MRDTFLPYCRPAVGEEEIAAVAAAMRNGWLTTGPQTQAFEREFARACDVPHAVALNSCTAGLHLALIALGIGPGDEVVMPSLTFVAGAQCALEIGARPVFCDVDPDTFLAGVREIAAAITPRTRAIVAMPYAGRPLGIGDVCAFAAERGIAVIEDAAHAAGMLEGGEWAGTRSAAAVYSFYATKNVATGEGGMLVTRDAALAERVRRLSLHGMSKDAWQRYGDRGTWRYDVAEPGYKYNITDLASSIGRVQLQRLPELQRRRDRIAQRYVRALGMLPGVRFQKAAEAGDVHGWCMFVALVDAALAGIGRDELIVALKDRNVGTSVHYVPTHTMTAYRRLAGVPLPHTEAIGHAALSLPLYPSMSDADVNDVIDAVRDIVGARAVVPASPALREA